MDYDALLEFFPEPYHTPLIVGLEWGDKTLLRRAKSSIEVSLGSGYSIVIRKRLYYNFRIMSEKEEIVYFMPDGEYQTEADNIYRILDELFNRKSNPKIVIDSLPESLFFYR